MSLQFDYLNVKYLGQNTIFQFPGHLLITYLRKYYLLKKTYQFC